MRRARRSSLFALLLLTAQAGPDPASVRSSDQDSSSGPAAGLSTPIEREDAARRRVEDSERVRALSEDAQREATEQAAQALADEKRLTVEQTEAFERLKRAEAAVSDMTSRVFDLNQRRIAAQTSIDVRVEALRRVVPIILRLSEYPVETLLSTQVPMEDAVRGILVVRTIARQAETDARALAASRIALDAATKAAEVAANGLAAAEAERSHETEVLAGQLAATKERLATAEQDAADAAKQAAAEAARANTLRSMLQILETQRRLEEAQAREEALLADRDKKATEAEAARLREAAMARPSGVGTIAADAKPAGQITAPVAGTLVRGWGDLDNGEAATGQSWRAPPGVRVMAPCGGAVVFAEPFHNYGLLVIIDCGGGYHAVLSGLYQIAVAPGRLIQTGDIVGTMRAATKTAAAGSATPVESPILYFELRKGGRPIDPAPWMKPPG